MTQYIENLNQIQPSNALRKLKTPLRTSKIEGSVNNNIANTLIPEKVVTFYKIHKPNNPCRSVIRPVSLHTSEILRFVEHQLQGNVKK